MSRIRFKGTTSADIPVPPAGKASLYYDDSDKALKMKLDNGDIIALGVTEEYIRDLVGALILDSDSLDVVYDDDGDTLKINLKPSIISDQYIDKISPTKIIDEQNGRAKATIITNDDVAASVYALDCSIDGCWMVELRITCRRLGGLAGSPGDGATFKRTFRVKSIGSSVTVHDLQSDYTSRDNPNINVLVSVSSTNILVKVKGLIDNNFKWNADIISSINT